jgi:tetratricopeptide (TPR) repeat protein
MKLLHCYSKNPEFYKKTMEILNKILAENPYDTEAHILKAVILMKQKYYDKAI